MGKSSLCTSFPVQHTNITLQCYITLRMAIKPPLTPPYLFVAFSVTSVLLSLVAFSNDLSVHGVSVAVLDLLSTIIPVAFAWIAGTLPLKTYKPALNVAGEKDVSSASPHQALHRTSLMPKCADSLRQAVVS